MLSFTPENAILAPYVASMGNEEIPDVNKEIFAKLISRFDVVSVRKDIIEDIIKDFIDKHIK